MELPDRAKILEVSSRVLEGGRVSIRNKAEEDEVYITVDDVEVRLARKPYVLGIGCRKGIRKSQFEGYIHSVLEDYRLDLRDIGLVTTVDIKKNEKGLLEFCKTPRSRSEIIEHLAIPSAQYALRHYLDPLIEAGAIRLTLPEKPRSPKQRYETVT